MKKKLVIFVPAFILFFLILGSISRLLLLANEFNENIIVGIATSLVLAAISTLIWLKAENKYGNKTMNTIGKIIIGLFVIFGVVYYLIP